MDLNNLSSNWKKLQATFKTETPKPPKRKPSSNTLETYRIRSKRPKKLNVSTPTVSKPGSTSKPTAMEAGSSSNFAQSAPSASLALWAEDNDIPPKDLAAVYGTSIKSTTLPATTGNAADEQSNGGLSAIAEAGKYIALDCEMVGVGPSPQRDSALARISIVDYNGRQLYDSYVRPLEEVTDYRTHVSGITPRLLQSARSLEAVQADVAKLLDGRILVGHSIRKDLDVLLLGHPKRDIRDTSRYPGFRKFAGGKTPSLKKLAREVLGVDIQDGEHSSVEDARATMLLFRKEKEGFEKEHAKVWGMGKKPDGATTSGSSGASKQDKKNRKRKGRKKHANK